MEIMPIQPPDIDYATYAAVHPDEQGTDMASRIAAAMAQLPDYALYRPFEEILREDGGGGYRLGSKGIAAMMRAVQIYGLDARVLPEL